MTKRKFLLFVLLSAVCITPNEIKAEEVILGVKENTAIDVELGCGNLHRKLLACEAYKCSDYRPGTNIPVHHYIKGKENNLCLHYQSAEDNDVIKCEYSEEGRKFVANMLQKQSQGYKTDQDEAAIMDEVFQSECKIEQFDFGAEGKI